MLAIVTIKDGGHVVGREMVSGAFTYGPTRRTATIEANSEPYRAEARIGQPAVSSEGDV